MVLPLRDNRNVAVSDEVFVTDRDGNELYEISASVTEPVLPDWDIDRAGSKGRVDVRAHQGVLQPNMWIAPYRTLTPEVGEIVRYPLGHWKLGRPSERYSGARALGSGDPYEPQEAVGSDIIDSIAAAKLREAFYTPAGGNVMSDVRTLIKMATAGRMGPNLLPNGGFEDGLTGWLTGWYGNGGNSSNITVATFDSASFPIPEGRRFLSVNLTSSAPAGAFRAIYQSIAIPAGASVIYAMARVRRPSTGVNASLTFDFRDASNTTVRYHETPAMIDVTSQFHSVLMVKEVPDGATTVSIGLMSSTSTTGTSQWLEWDDVRVGTATRMPLPDSRISLPISDAAATTRIQTTAGKSIGYHAINADRLAAIAHQAVYTTLSGNPTTSPMRVVATTTPKRTYGPGDLRIIGGVEIPAIPTDIPNHFIAIKESFEEGVAPMYAESWNDNPHDDFSIVNADVVSAEPIYVQDAVSQAALQAVADDARDRYSTQEEIHFTITPDLELTVYDVIEITDPAMPKAMGKWAIQYIGFDGPLMTISARRAIGGG